VIQNERHPQFRIAPLGDQHNRRAFSCGVQPLDRYLHNQAGQDIRKHTAAVFVLTPDGETIAGFCTLSAHIVNLGDLPEKTSRKLPRYPNLPATLLGRLAVSLDFRGQGIGQLLLLDAFHRTLATSADIASLAVVVDTKNEASRAFFLHHDFIPFPSNPNRLFYPVASIKQLFASKPDRT
jgi:GNAT superfamily N-acetyltransferase